MPHVLDTNVYVSAALTEGPPRRLVGSLVVRGDLVTSRFILDELLEVLRSTPELRDKVPPSVAARYVAFVERHARLVEPASVDWPDEPADATVLGTALAAGEGAILVTGDKKLRRQADRFGVRAVRVRQALEDPGR